MKHVDELLKRRFYNVRLTTRKPDELVYQQTQRVHRRFIHVLAVRQWCRLLNFKGIFFSMRKPLNEKIAYYSNHFSSLLQSLLHQ